MHKFSGHSGKAVPPKHVQIAKSLTPNPEEIRNRQIYWAVIRQVADEIWNRKPTQ